MESPLGIGQLLLLALVIGAPVHCASTLVFAVLARRRFRLRWSHLALLAPAWLASSLLLQLAIWQWLGDVLPERVFMLFGFVHSPALAAGAVMLVAVFVFSRGAKVGSAS
jgi:hypothetical protein